MSGNQHISVNRTPVFSHPRCGVFCFNVTTAYLLSALHRQNQSEVLYGVPQVLGTDKNLMVSSQDFTKNDQQQWNQDAQSLQLHWCVVEHYHAEGEAAPYVDKLQIHVFDFVRCDSSLQNLW